MIKKIVCFLCVFGLTIGLMGCSSKGKEVKIGVSMGVGPAARWESEITFMEERAKELGVALEARLNRTDEPLTQEEECKEMIDSGIDVLILVARDVNNVQGILDYAKKKDVKVLSYARSINSTDVDLYVGYDSEKIGQMMGDYVSELVYKGDYIILKGDENDHNAELIHNGAMKSINKIKDINIIAQASITAWDPALAKEFVKESVIKNGNKVDAIFAPNDKLAGASYEALMELGIQTPVVITGMDAELDAIKRIAAGTQGCSVYMDLKELAYTAVNEAVHMAKGEDIHVNAQFEINNKESIDANMIVGNLITNKNIDKQIIDKKVFTKEQVYE